MPIRTKTVFGVLLAAAVGGCCKAEFIGVSTAWTPEGAQKSAELGARPPTVGVALDALAARAVRLMKRSEHEQRVLEHRTASHALAFTSYARAAFADHLGRSMDELPGAMLEQIGQIRNLVEAADRRNVESFDWLGSRTEVLSMAIETSHVQKVRRLPKLVLQGVLEETTVVEFDGDYPDANAPWFTPYLDVNGQAIAADLAAETKLRFLVPKALLDHRGTTVEFLPTRLKLPQSGRCADVSLIDVPIVLLPDSPGKLVIRATKQSMKHDVERVVTKEFVHEQSVNAEETVHCEPVEPGWSVDMGKVELTMVREEGKKGETWFDGGNESSATQACWKVKTAAFVPPKDKARGKKERVLPAKLVFKLTYTRFRDTPFEEAVSEELRPAWGETKTLQLLAGWRLKYVRFDGATFEYDAADTSNAFLRLTRSGDRGLTYRFVP